MIFAIVIGLWCLGLILAPFPYWPTYWRLWRTLLFARLPAIGARARGIQAWLLLRYLLLTPCWTLLWYLDELLFPGYRQQVINPVFIVGEPRSGTTLLHRTMAADDQTFFAVRHSEWRFPFLTLQLLMRALGIDQRLSRMNYWPSTDSGREAARMHPNSLSDWEEDGIFYEERFLHHFFLFLRFPYPELLADVDNFQALPEHVRRRVLEVHNRVLQKVKYLRGKHDLVFLSKEVTSHDKIEALLRFYPSARFVFVFRRSADFMSSLLALMRASTFSKTGVDPALIPDWEAVLVERMRADTNRVLGLSCEHVDASRQVRVAYSQMVGSLESAVSAIYDGLGEDLGPEYRAFLAALDQRQKSRERGYDYGHRAFAGFDAFDAFVDQVERDSPPRWDVAMTSAIVADDREQFTAASP